ncbi:MAG: hypothetical protein WCA07_11275 [Gloeobacterales cyanobacterium]
MRKYWLGPKEDTWKPSREGFALSAEELPEALKALQAIQMAGV